MTKVSFNQIFRADIELGRAGGMSLGELTAILSRT